MTAWALALLLTTVPLVDAVKQHDADAVRALLRQKMDVNAPEGDGATALHWAAYGDHADLVDLLLAAGARVNVANDLSITPLYLASANGNAAIVSALLARGATADAASETGVTPLMEAARGGHAAVVRVLLQHGADPNVREGERDQTALMWAAARGRTDVVTALLDHGATIHARSRVRAVTVMLDQGPRRAVKTSAADAKQIDAGGRTALLFAAQEGHAAVVTRLLAAGADKDDRAADGNTALVVAALSGHRSAAQVLIDAGANPDTAGAGYSALHASVLRGDLATVQALLRRGANPNVALTNGSPVRRFGAQWALPRTLMGATPLAVAAIYLELDIMRALLAAGADVSLGLVDGTTPLLAAAGAAVEKEVRPSDLERWNVVNIDQPIIPRAETDVLAATALLLDAGAGVNHVSLSGDTALHAAAGAGLTTVIRLLVERGATLDLVNRDGQTPLSLTLPGPLLADGRPSPRPGLKAAEELLRKLGATR